MNRPVERDLDHRLAARLIALAGEVDRELASTRLVLGVAAPLVDRGVVVVPAASPGVPGCRDRHVLEDEGLDDALGASDVLDLDRMREEPLAQQLVAADPVGERALGIARRGVRERASPGQKLSLQVRRRDDVQRGLEAERQLRTSTMIGAPSSGMAATSSLMSAKRSSASSRKSCAICSGERSSHISSRDMVSAGTRIASACFHVRASIEYSHRS